MRRIILSLSIVAFLGLVSVFGAFLFFSPPAETGEPNPPVSWDPKHLVVTLTPGEGKAVQATATIRSDIPETSVEVVPSLIPYVTVQPQTLPPLSAGMEPTIQITFWVSSETPFQTIEGTLHLRTGSATKSRPLPITLNIWPVVDSDEVVFNYPPGWQAENFSGTEGLPPFSSVESPFGSMVYVLPEGGFDYGVDPEVTTNRSDITIDGEVAVRVDFLDPTGQLLLVRVTFEPTLAEKPDFLINFGVRIGDSDAQRVFEQILETMQIR